MEAELPKYIWDNKKHKNRKTEEQKNRKTEEHKNRKMQEQENEMEPGR